MFHFASPRILRDSEPAITRVACGRCPRILLGATKFSYPTDSLVSSSAFCTYRHKGSYAARCMIIATSELLQVSSLCGVSQRNFCTVCIVLQPISNQFDNHFSAGRNPTLPVFSCPKTTTPQKHEGEASPNDFLPIRCSNLREGHSRIIFFQTLQTVGSAYLDGESECYSHSIFVLRTSGGVKEFCSPHLSLLANPMGENGDSNCLLYVSISDIPTRGSLSLSSFRLLNRRK